MEAIATLKYLKASPQKVRLVADLVRGKKVEEALQILRFTKKTSENNTTMEIAQMTFADASIAK